MSFKDIKGQSSAIGLLQEYIGQSRLAGGYLFTGAEGIGKKLVALTLAKTLNCLEMQEDCCDKCASCLKIENNQHPDVHIIDPEDSEIKIDNIRQLQREISFKPYEGKMKVFIINQAHRLNAESSNALLKILEEPPKNSLIILVSGKPALLFKTITSRCKAIKFSALKRAELSVILEKEHGLDKDSAHFLAYYSEGRLGFAIRLKDTDLIREKNAVINKLALSQRIDLDGLPLKDKADLRSHLNILATWFRDIYLIKIGLPHSEVINYDRKNDLLKVMVKFSFPELNVIMRAISDSLLQLEQNINTKLLLYNLGAQIWKD